MNNKGFTLIELLATIMLLAIIMTVTTISIISIVESTNEKSYKLLIEDIKIAAQGYFEECEGSSLIETNIECDLDLDGKNDATENNEMEFKLEDLLKYGFLKGTDNDGNKNVIDPITNNNINLCPIEIKKINGINYKIDYEVIATEETITKTNAEGESIEIDCPTTENYKGNF